MKGKRKLKIDKKGESINEEYTNIDVINEQPDGKSSYTFLKFDTSPKKMEEKNDEWTLLDGGIKEVE